MLRVAFVLWFGSIAPALAQAQPMTEAAAQLASRISSLLQRRATVSLEIQNLAQLTPQDSSNFRSALEDELRKSGLETTATAQPDVRLRVTASENPRGLLLVAEVLSGENRQLVMLPWTAPPRAESKPHLRVTAQQVWEQPEPILDLALLDSGATMLILGPGKLSMYRMLNGKWTPGGAVAVSLTRPLPRDPRGRLTAAHAYFPGASCSVATQPDLRLTCLADNERFALGSVNVRWQSDRDLLESDGVRGAFYSTAAGFTATADARVVDRSGEAVSGADAWGSDLAAIDNPCGADPVVLASSAGDNYDRDAVEAYEMEGSLARAASESFSLPGRVTALWPAETSHQVTLVVRNFKTGNYEASRLGLACAE
jgi:hypothetical protein